MCWGVFLSDQWAGYPMLSVQGSLDRCRLEAGNEGSTFYSALLSLCSEKSILFHDRGLENITDGFNP